MDSLTLFVVSILIVAIVVLIANFKSLGKAIEYLKQNKDIAKGILIFAGAAIVSVVIFAPKAQADYFNYVDIYVGIEQPKSLSPQCEEGGVNDRLTSNGGLVANVWQSQDQLFDVNAKYTHHSCALNEDRNTYDSFGVELKYRFKIR